MDTSIENAILPFKLQQFVAFIMEKKRFSLKDALCYLYSTELYGKLSFHSAEALKELRFLSSEEVG